MSNQMGSEMQLIIHAKLQVLFVSITGPVTTNLDQLPRDPNLKCPGSSTSPKRMPCESAGIWKASRLENRTKSADKNGACKPF